MHTYTNGYTLVYTLEREIDIVPVEVKQKSLPGHFWWSEVGVELIAGVNFFREYNEAERRRQYLQQGQPDHLSSQALYDLAVATANELTCILRIKDESGKIVDRVAGVLSSELSAILGDNQHGKK